MMVRRPVLLHFYYIFVEIEVYNFVLLFVRCHDATEKPTTNSSDGASLYGKELPVTKQHLIVGDHDEFLTRFIEFRPYATV